MSDYPKIEVPKNCCDGKKNEDAKKIKELLDDGCFDCCTNQYPVSRDSVKEVWAIAERMAAEIERLETADVLSDEVALKNTKYIEELEAEITQLKAELEKRPEVVRCGECKKKDLGFTCPLICANAVIKAKTKTENFIVFDDNDFCSAGQRRESEEGK